MPDPLVGGCALEIGWCGPFRKLPVKEETVHNVQRFGGVDRGPAAGSSSVDPSRLIQPCLDEAVLNEIYESGCCYIMNVFQMFCVCLFLSLQSNFLI